MGRLLLVIEEITILGVYASKPIVGDTDFETLILIAECKVKLLCVVLVEAGIAEGGEGESLPGDTCLWLDADTAQVGTTPQITADEACLDEGIEITLFYQFYLRCFLFFLCQSRCRQQGDGHQGQ